LISVNFCEGQDVKEGEALARIDPNHLLVRNQGGLEYSAVSITLCDPILDKVTSESRANPRNGAAAFSLPV
jgi:multidrug efflux pump subunit AcrA (membrane-fusion protein)